MIWELPQLRMIQHYGAQLAVSPDALKLGKDAYVVALAQKLYQQVQDMAWTLAAELDIEDMHFTWSEPPAPEFGDLRFLRARWRPESKQVLFRNGPLEGKRLTVAPEVLAGERIMAMEGMDAPLWNPSGPAEEKLPTWEVEYRLDGWDEESRSWVYAIKEGK